MEYGVVGVGAYVQVLLALLVVLLIIYLFLHRGLDLFMKKHQQNRQIKIIEKTFLSHKNYLCIVEVEQKRLLLLVSENQMNLIAELKS